MRFSIFGGINFSGGNGKNSLSGGNIGVGFHSHLKNPNVRLDIGASIQKYDYFAITIVHTKQTYIWGDDDEYMEIFGDKGNSVNINPFFTLTINSNDNSNLINYFGTFGFFTQSILNFNPGETHFSLFPFINEQTIIDERAQFTSAFFYLNPGLAFNLESQIKIILSTKLLLNLGEESRRPRWWHGRRKKVRAIGTASSKSRQNTNNSMEQPMTRLELEKNLVEAECRRKHIEAEYSRDLATAKAAYDEVREAIREASRDAVEKAEKAQLN